MFSKSKHDQEEKNRKPVNTFIKKSLSMAALAAMAVSVLWVSGFTTYAKRKLPTGDMNYIPETQYCGEIEAPKEQVGKLLPNEKNVDLTTGEHYKYLSTDEKILYEALYMAVMNDKYLHYKDAAQRKNSQFINDILYPFYTGDRLYLDYYPNNEAYNRALNRAQEACYYDHPDHVELYMIYGNDMYSSKGKDDKITSYLLFIAKEDDTKFAGYDAEIAKSLNDFVALYNVMCSSSATIAADCKWEAYREWLIHDIYCTTNYGPDYDEANLSKQGDAGYFDYAHTAYGSLVLGKAVCDGYSAGFEMIMNKLNVNAMVITGDAVTPVSSGGHAWNIVQLDGNWYEVDTTWDDTNDANHPALYTYFNKTTQEYSNGIANSYHKRTANEGYCGFKMPLARGTHWTIDRILANTPYTHDTTVYVSALRIEDNFDLNYSKTYEPKVTIFPDTATNKEYTLTSSNPDVVSVDGTTVTGLKIGTATLTATSKDGLISDSCLVTVTVFEGSEFTKSGNTYRITGENTAELIGSTKATVNIPATFKVGTITFKVTGIADNAFKKNKKITTIKGGKNLVSIGKNAFRECSKLKNIKLSSAKSLKEIGATAFYKSGKVTTLQLSVDSLKTIGKNALGKINKEAKFTITASSKKKYNKIVKALKKAGAKEATYEKAEKKK